MQGSARLASGFLLPGTRGDRAVANCPLAEGQRPAGAEHPDSRGLGAALLGPGCPLPGGLFGLETRHRRLFSLSHTFTGTCTDSASPSSFRTTPFHPDPLPWLSGPHCAPLLTPPSLLSPGAGPQALWPSPLRSSGSPRPQSWGLKANYRGDTRGLDCEAWGAACSPGRLPTIGGSLLPPHGAAAATLRSPFPTHDISLLEISSDRGKKRDGGCGAGGEWQREARRERKLADLSAEKGHSRR